MTVSRVECSDKRLLTVSRVECVRQATVALSGLWIQRRNVVLACGRAGVVLYGRRGVVLYMYILLHACVISFFAFRYCAKSDLFRQLLFLVVLPKFDRNEHGDDG